MNINITITQGALKPAKPWSVDGAGAMTCFDGVVRPLESDAEIAGLSYELYRPMAENMLRKLADQTMEQFSLLAVRIEHSEGWVAVGECSFRLQIASRHRAENLQATAWFIDQMKKDVPIWKHPVARCNGEPQA